MISGEGARGRLISESTGTPSHCMRKVLSTKSTTANAIARGDDFPSCAGKKSSNGTKSPAIKARNTTQPRNSESTQ